MPLKDFIHPETGEKVNIKECLEKGLLSEYYTLAFLKMASSDRKWNGIPSTTQLLNGYRKNYLQILCDYATAPDSRAFMIIGSRGHHELEINTPEDSISEMLLKGSGVSGIFDLLEKQPNGDWWLVDYKVTGSYGIIKSLGMVKDKQPMFDKDGEPVLYQKSGKWGKAGDQKMENVWKYDADIANEENFNWKMQLNKYRMDVENLSANGGLLGKYKDIIISKLRVFAIVRDGGLAVASSRGITKSTYFIDVPFVDNDEVESFYSNRKENLLMYLKDLDKKYESKELTEAEIIEYMPERCTDKECWTGNMCRSYCDLAEFCRKKGDNPYLPKEEEDVS